MKESRRFYPNKELARAPARLRRPRQRRAERSRGGLRQGRSRQGRQADRPERCARGTSFGRLERAPTSGGSLELTIDEQLQYIAERELRAGVEEKRADGGSASSWIRRPAEILALASWPTFNPNAFGDAERTRPPQSRGAGHLRAGIDLQGRHHRRRARRARDVGRHDDRHQSRRLSASRRRVIDEFEGHNYGVLSLTDVIVKSSNVGAVKIGFASARSGSGCTPTASGSAARPRPTFPARAPASLWPATS